MERGEKMKLRKSQLQAIIQEELSQGGHFAKPDKSHKSELKDMKKAHDPRKMVGPFVDSAILRRIIKVIKSEEVDDFADDSGSIEAIRRILRDANKI
jgi:hypothetical protein